MTANANEAFNIFKDIVKHVQNAFPAKEELEHNLLAYKLICEILEEINSNVSKDILKLYKSSSLYELAKKYYSWRSVKNILKKKGIKIDTIYEMVLKTIELLAATPYHV